MAQDWWESAPLADEDDWWERDSRADSDQWWSSAPVVSPAPRRESTLESWWRIYGGAAGDFVDAGAAVVYDPINAVLRQTGINFQIPTRQIGTRIAQPERASGRFARGALPYVAGTAGAARGLVTAVAGAASRPLATAAVAGAATDTTLSSVNDQNLSNLVDDLTGVRLPTARVEGENAGVAALKDTVEGLALGGAVDLTIRGLRGPADFVSRAFTDPVTPPRAAGSAVEPVPGAAAADGADDASRAADAAPEPPPDTFDIVRPVERGGFWPTLQRRISERGVFGATWHYAERLYTAGIAQQHPLVRTVERLRSDTEALTGRPENIPASADPRKLARGGYDAMNIGMMDVMHGVHGYRQSVPQSPAMGDVLAAASARAIRAGDDPEVGLSMLNEYVAARRATQEWDRFARGEITAEPISIPKDQTDAFIARMEAEHPWLTELAESASQYSQALWRKRFESGLIDRATYDAALAARDFHVPLQRVLDDGPRRTGRPSNRASAMRRFEGSQRDIEGPIETLIRQTHELNLRIRQNDINRSLVDMARRLDDLAGPDAVNPVMRRVSEAAEQAPAQKPADELIDTMLDEQGAPLYQPGAVNEGGRPVLYVWRDGKREAWELVDPDWGRETFDAVTGMSRQQQDLLTNTVASASQVLRLGITTNPEFLITDFVRNQLQAWTLTDVGYNPLIDGFRGLWIATGAGDGVRKAVAGATGRTAATPNADLQRLYNLSGGIFGGEMTAATREVVQQADVRKLQAMGYRVHDVKDLKGFLAATRGRFDLPTLLRTAELSETGTRLVLFKRALERAKKQGLEEPDALLEAAYVARDLMDFGRNGARMVTARKTITFLNAQIQGVDKTLRAGVASGAFKRVDLKEALRPLFGMQPRRPMRKEDEAALRLAGKVWVKVAAMAVFGVTLTGLYRDDEWYQGLSEYTRNRNWAFMGGNGGRDVYLIPKPHELAIVSNVMERAFEAIYYNDPTAWDRLAGSVADSLTPPTDTPLVRVPMELATNTNLHTGGPIVPEERLDDLPQDQFNNWSSELAMSLGEWAGVSPAQIDHLFTGFGGTWGRWILGASNLTDPDRPGGGLTDMVLTRRFVSDSTRGSQDKTAFFERVGGRQSDLNRAYNSVRSRFEAGRASDAALMLESLDDEGRLYVLSQLVGLDENGAAAQRRLHPLARARTVNLEISRVIGELYRSRPKDGGEPLPPMTAQEKGMLHDALEALAVAEMRNAMIATRQPGYVGREPHDRASLMDDVHDINPAVANELERRLITGSDRAYSYDAIMDLWPRVESRLDEYGTDADMLDLSSEAMARSGF